MDWTNLTPDQLRKLRHALDAPRWQMVRLVGRMKLRGFPATDPLLASAERACDAVDELFKLVESMSYGQHPLGTGRTMPEATPRDGRARRT